MCHHTYTKDVCFKTLFCIYGSIGFISCYFVEGVGKFFDVKPVDFEYHIIYQCSSSSNLFYSVLSGDFYLTPKFLLYGISYFCGLILDRIKSFWSLTSSSICHEYVHDYAFDMYLDQLSHQASKEVCHHYLLLLICLPSSGLEQ